MDNMVPMDASNGTLAPHGVEGAKIQDYGVAAGVTTNSTAPSLLPNTALGNPEIPSGIDALAAVALQAETSASRNAPLNNPATVPPPVLPRVQVPSVMKPPIQAPILPSKKEQPRTIAILENIATPKSLLNPPKIGLLADTRPVVPRPTPKRDLFGGPVAFPAHRGQSRIIDPPAFAMKRPGGSFAMPLPPAKKAKIEMSSGGLPTVPMQPKLKASSPAKPATPKSDDGSPMQVDKKKKKFSMDVFPGGRGVPSPTIGVLQRFVLSPLVEMTFSNKLAINRNPFRTSTHRPGDLCEWKRNRSNGKGLQKPAVVPPKVLASPITISVIKPGAGGLFDSAEGDGIAPKQLKRQKVKKKKTVPVHKRVPLDKANFSSPKDINAAKRLLAGIHDTSCILPMDEAMWLGRTLWILTIEQLDYSLTSCHPPGDELRRAVALGSLVDRKQTIGTKASSLPGASSLKTGAAPVKVEPSNGASHTSSSPANSPLAAAKKVDNTTSSSPVKVETYAKPSNDRAAVDGKIKLASSISASGIQTDTGNIPMDGEASGLKTIPQKELIGAPGSKTLKVIDGLNGDSKPASDAVANISAAFEANRTSDATPSSGINGQGDKKTTERINPANVQSKRYLAVPVKETKQETVIADAKNSKLTPEQVSTTAVASKIVEANGEAPRVKVVRKPLPSHPRGKQPNEDQLRKADEILKRWRERVAEFKTAGMDPKISNAFYLSGPVGQLLPKLVRQFLSSVRITNLLSFFSLKKTEASPLIQYYRDWRTHCDLPPMKGHCLARHLLGMSNRIEKAVRSMPPADEEVRNWMKTVLVVLTGSSKDFIVDECKVVDVEFFLNERTKEWSDRLVVWREQNNLPPLKGSGKVAMVSGWKTMLKEAMDVEKGKGRVLKEAELLQMPSPDPEDIVMEVEPVLSMSEVKEKKKKPMKKQPKPTKPITFTSGKSALHSEDFLSSILRPENIKFLHSVGITTSEQLIGCDKQLSSPMILELMKFRTEATGVPAQAPTCVRLMYDWTQRVKNKIEEIQSDTVKPLAKKRGPRQKDEGEPQPPSEAIEPVVIVVPVKKQPSKPPRSRGVTKFLKDPMGALSANTRTFLKSINIADSETFLQTKTSIIASTYIAWRAKENMATLKGYGAIATVSGWKAQVRKAGSDPGRQDLTAKEPVARQKVAPIEDTSAVENTKPSTLDQLRVIPKAFPCLLFGMQERRFYMQGPTGITFAFNLTVRQSSSVASQLSTYVTYLGQRRDSAFWPHQDKLGIIDLDPDRLPLLVDVSDSWEQTDERLLASPFASIMEGCGLCDLGRYNVVLPQPDNLNILKQDIMHFLEGKSASTNPILDKKRKEASDLAPANLFLLDTHLCQSTPVFFHPKPLEKGQTVELRLSTIGPICAASPPKESSNIVLRNKIASRISRLPLPNIKKILQWAVDQSLPPFSISIGKHTSSIVLRRRFHWVATALLDHFEKIEEISLKSIKGHHPDHSMVYKIADSLLMKNQHFQAIRSAEDPTKDPSYDPLITEILDELEASLIANTHGVAPSDPSAYCEFALSLRQKCKNAASKFVVLKAPQSLQFQEALLEELCHTAVQAVESFFSERVSLERLVLQRPNDEGVEESFLATGSDWHVPVFRPLMDVKSGDAEINRHWYLQYQILGAVHAVAASSQIRWLRTPNPVYTYSILTSKVEKCLVQNRYSLEPLVKAVPPNWSLTTRFVDRVHFSQTIPLPMFPHSLPLFLGLVWPKLRGNFGWRLDAGFSRDDVAFLPPGGKNRAKRRHDRSAKIKQERQRKRAKLDKRLREVGFGYVPKLTKRLVVQTDQSESGALKVERTVSQVFDNFSDHILSKTSNPASESNKERVRSIMGGLRTCFGTLLPLLDDSVMVDDDSHALSKTYGCEQLVPMLVLMPSILQQSGLPIRQIEDSISMLKEFVRYITENIDESFDPEYRPFEEEYDGSEEIADEFLSAKLDSVASRDGKGGDNKSGSEGKLVAADDETMVRDLVQAGDEADLTAFTATAMRQMMPCRATLSDTVKKGRKHIPVGYPGMVCTHCWGTGEGKYFFTSSDSLGTAGGVVYGHLLKCQKFPADKLKKLTAFKSQQSEARKKLKHGAQAAYFNRLWKRLHNAKTIGTAGVFVVSADNQSREESLPNEESKLPTYGQSTPNDGNKKHIEFQTHLELLDYIQTTAPWNKEAVLEEAVDLYYGALRRGSRIYNTNAMPATFTSEWLLAKVSPVSLHNASRSKQATMAG